MKKETMNETTSKVLEGQVVTGQKMSDGSPVEGYVVGFTPFTYILPKKEIDAACCTGRQQVKIEVTAERILARS